MMMIKMLMATKIGLINDDDDDVHNNGDDENDFDEDDDDEDDDEDVDCKQKAVSQNIGSQIISPHRLYLIGDNNNNHDEDDHIDHDYDHDHNQITDLQNANFTAVPAQIKINTVCFPVTAMRSQREVTREERGGKSGPKKRKKRTWCQVWREPAIKCRCSGR